jgi:hypothetical protein
MIGPIIIEFQSDSLVRPHKKGDITIRSEQVKSENSPFLTTASVTFPKYEENEK